MAAKMKAFRIASERSFKPRRRATLESLLALACVLSAGINSSAASVVHVNIMAPPGGNGTSWASAMNSLEGALASTSSGDQVWIARGTYLVPFFASFAVKSGVSLYGGFDGTESTLDQAQPAVHQTTLKGASQGDPASGQPVVVVQGSSSTTIDGFTIRDGFAPNRLGRKGGGGLFIGGGSVAVSNCIFTENTTFVDPGADYGRGGAICITDGAVVAITDCTFDANSTHGSPPFTFLPFHVPAPGDGGAVYVEDSTLSIRSSIFLNNRGGSTSGNCVTGFYLDAGDAASGGALCALDSSVTIASCTFTGNASGSSQGRECLPAFPWPEFHPGGAAGNGGAVSLNGGTATISRCVFVGNQAGTSDLRSGSGGALSAAGSAYIANCRFLGNSAGAGFGSGDAGDGGALAATQYIVLANCEIIGNHAGVSDAAGVPPGIDGAGGALYATALPRVWSCTIAGNTARWQGAGVAGAVLENSIVYWNSSASLGYALEAQVVGGSALSCIVQNWPSPNPFFNLDLNPVFVDLAGPDQTLGTLDDNSRPAVDSPAIDSGNPYPPMLDTADLDGDGDTNEWIPIDLAGTVRMIDIPGVPNTAFGNPPIDRGTYEFISPGCPADLDSNGQVDDADFVVFVQAYNLLDCSDPVMPAGCPADLDADGFVGDGDFVLFAAAYAELVCP